MADVEEVNLTTELDWELAMSVAHAFRDATNNQSRFSVRASKDENGRRTQFWDVNIYIPKVQEATDDRD